MHICAKYGHIMTNYAMKMAMTTVICLESHECSYMISLFVKFFKKKNQNSSLLFFLTNSTYKRTPCKRIAFFDSFFIFFGFSKIGSKSPAHLFIANIWIFQQHVWLLHRKLLYYLKMNFGHTQEQTITHLQYKFELLSGNQL